MRELGLFWETKIFVFIFTLKIFLDPRNFADLNPLQNEENFVFLKQTFLSLKCTRIIGWW